MKRVVGWLDSTVALHWIRVNGEFKQFVANRVRKIREKDYIQWRHVPSQDNPADLGSRGGHVNNTNRLWWEGPDWLTAEENWPPEIVTSPSEESLAETIPVREIFNVAVPQPDTFDQLLKKWSLWKTLRICAWISRFPRNAGKQCVSIKGPLLTEEIKERETWWINRVQTRNQDSLEFKEDRARLNLKLTGGILTCHGRIQGDFPIYLPDNDLYTEKLVEHSHIETLHGGVSLTMAKVREIYWIPRLRRLAKRIIKRCFGCKRFQAVPCPNPQPGNLPKDRTEGDLPFQVVGVDYAGPIRYRSRRKKEAKAYIIVYACALTRALYLELTKTMSTEEFLATFKRFIARKGRPQKVYSDNAKTFAAGAKWLKLVMHDERFNDFLAKMSIQWQFNLSRAPWWGGQYERLIGVVKQALYKTIGNGFLSWSELEDVILDVEVTLNNRPLSYVEDDVQLPVLTPNSLQFCRLQLYPLELSCDVATKTPETRPKTMQLKADVPEFRPRRNAAVVAECRIQDMASDD